MALATEIPGYKDLIRDISSIYDSARGSSQVEVNENIIRAYWDIGRRIVEVEQENQERAGYGSGLIQRLSEDLNTRYNRGFSKSSLKYMRKFYFEYRKGHICGQLSWSHYKALMSVRDKEQRKRLEQLAIEEKMSNPVLQRTIRIEAPSARADSDKLKMRAGRLYVYKVIMERLGTWKRSVFNLDLGFGVIVAMPGAQPDKARSGDIVESKKRGRGYRLETVQRENAKFRYAYEAYVDRVVDGDTLVVYIDCGFKTYVHKRLRLHGINTPEMGMRGGVEARDFVISRLKGVRKIAIKTYGSDRYDRYLADVMYRRGELETDRILENGRFLNQELLDQGFAVRG